MDSATASYSAARSLATLAHSTAQSVFHLASPVRCARQQQYMLSEHPGGLKPVHLPQPPLLLHPTAATHATNPCSAQAPIQDHTVCVAAGPPGMQHKAYCLYIGVQNPEKHQSLLVLHALTCARSSSCARMSEDTSAAVMAGDSCATAVATARSKLVGSCALSLAVCMNWMHFLTTRGMRSLSAVTSHCHTYPLSPGLGDSAVPGCSRKSSHTRATLVSAHLSARPRMRSTLDQVTGGRLICEGGYSSLSASTHVNLSSPGTRSTAMPSVMTVPPPPSQPPLTAAPVTAVSVTAGGGGGLRVRGAWQVPLLWPGEPKGVVGPVTAVTKLLPGALRL
mmetsp:Transcript_12076/g.29449  ORF Transcript_12076/g.29449 Transcript_12076/m.29449 type:complete len:336 (-) Transcript_12076:728-1735(-)